MNDSASKRNPFSAGRWVTGEHFFCRHHLLDALLSSNESCDWVIGKRRVGKTSLLRQLEYLVNGNAGERFALFWDIQGSFDSAGLHESLLDAVEDSRDLYPDSWQAIALAPENFDDAPSLLKALARQFHRANMRVHLLIDEAEEFINIGKDNVTVLGKLRKLFHNSRHLHTVISSTPRLEQLHKTIEIETSPFLHGFHARYLGNFTRESCLALLGRGFADEQTIQRITDMTAGNPFEIQLFAKHLFESGDFDEVLLQLEANPSLIQVIEVNFDLLTEDEQDLMKDVFAGKNQMTAFTDNADKVAIAKLIQLGYLCRQAENALQVGSYFQLQWLRSRHNASPSFHAQNQTDEQLATQHQNLVARQILTLYKFFLELAQDSQCLVDFDNAFKVSAIDQTIYPDRSRLQLTEAKSDQQPWMTAIIYTVAMLKHYLGEKPESWSLFRLYQLTDQMDDHQAESDYLDLMALIGEEASLTN